MKYEYVISYKCACNDKIHNLTFGEKKTSKKPKVSNIFCPECKKKITPVSVELLEVDKKEINRVEVALSEFTG